MIALYDCNIRTNYSLKLSSGKCLCGKGSEVSITSKLQGWLISDGKVKYLLIGGERGNRLLRWRTLMALEALPWQWEDFLKSWEEYTSTLNSIKTCIWLCPPVGDNICEQAFCTANYGIALILAKVKDYS